MFGVFKKSAASLAELLIILAVVGILSVLYQRTVNTEAIEIKYAYKNLIDNMVGYTATKTDTYTKLIPEDAICEDFFDTVNTLGDKNCTASSVPMVPNLTTTSGMRFFNLYTKFNDFDNVGIDAEKSIFIDVDLDGLVGDNKEGKDIFALELLRNGRIRPTGKPVLDSSGSPTKIKGNIVRDPELYSVKSAYVIDGDVKKDNIKNMGTRLAYAEAQCLSGNIFPYRSNVYPYEMQMCVEDTNSAKVKQAISDLKESKITYPEREETIRRYWLARAIDGSICKDLYSDDKKTVASGLARGADAVIGKDGYCHKCYKAAYKAKYCKGVTTATTECPDYILAENGECLTPQWAEVSQ